MDKRNVKFWDSTFLRSTVLGKENQKAMRRDKREELDLRSVNLAPRCQYSDDLYVR